MRRASFLTGAAIGRRGRLQRPHSTNEGTRSCLTAVKRGLVRSIRPQVRDEITAELGPYNGKRERPTGLSAGNYQYQ